MSKTDMTYKTWGIEEGVHEACGLKPMLSPYEQVALLKGKGVDFKRCDENTAIEALSHKGTHLHIASYRRLFQKHESGSHKGKYVHLDFADLLYLDGLDGDVRRAFLLASQDVERLAKTALVTRISDDSGEDGYSIVADFMESLEERYRRYITRDLRARRGNDADSYSGGIIDHYQMAMPVWALLEVISFGSFLSFYLFCSRRWNDKTMRGEYFSLKGTKAVRNSTSHGACILNGFDRCFESTNEFSAIDYDWLKKVGISNNSHRRSKLKNRRILQLLETLVMYDRLEGRRLSPKTAEVLSMLKTRLDEASVVFGIQNSFVSYLRFLANLIDKIA